MRILVVEDEPMVAELLQRVLEAAGNSCILAHDAAAATAALDEHAVDAVTLDLTIPGSHGLVWLEQLAERRPELARSTLIITATQLDPPAIERVARCGAGVLAKPFTLDALTSAVRSQIERPGAIRLD